MKHIANSRLIRIFRVLLIVTVLSLVIVYVLAAWLSYEAASRPRQSSFERLTPQGEFQFVQFPSRGQGYMVYAFYQVGDPDQPVIINVHGYRGSRSAVPVLERANTLHDRGYSVLTIDLSDNGTEDLGIKGDTIGNGRISFGYSERWDVLGGFDYLIGLGIAPSRIGLLGESMGATSSLMAAAEEPRIRAVWSDSAYSRADTELMEQARGSGIPDIIVPGGLFIGMLRTGDRIWEVQPITQGAIFAAQGQAISLVQCEQDLVVLPHHGSDLAAAYQTAKVNVTWWQVGCKEHSNAFWFAREEYLSRLTAFFAAYLLPT